MVSPRFLVLGLEVGPCGATRSVERPRNALMVLVDDLIPYSVQARGTVSGRKFDSITAGIACRVERIDDIEVVKRLGLVSEVVQEQTKSKRLCHILVFIVEDH